MVDVYNSKWMDACGCMWFVATRKKKMVFTSSRAGALPLTRQQCDGLRHRRLIDGDVQRDERRAVECGGAALRVQTPLATRLARGQWCNARIEKNRRKKIVFFAHLELFGSGHYGER